MGTQLSPYFSQKTSINLPTTPNPMNLKNLSNEGTKNPKIQKNGIKFLLSYELEAEAWKRQELSPQRLEQRRL
ncbi:hypothetical protein C922_05661 [Plasmodium inui San Antonio 1]|uniref:Uncharacterized protein n=1 Tax=Plasmodium inui San Antonio 1 TaxID=1237626 RepID=W6ZXC2_9APIC|nr:hypothetical protein C922_05661 [Plasmodium inui San Antonio 1]EUD63958.1 hypothetical protein C922_05661 [Plasmodium inui San Antonio 1]